MYEEASCTVDFRRSSAEGQLLTEERKFLYWLVREHKPNTVCEVGTWRGGGSTYVIAGALCDGKIPGCLYTSEVDMTALAVAMYLYNHALEKYRDYVSFALMPGAKRIREVADMRGVIDMLFLDGAQNTRGAVEELGAAMPALRAGAVVACHDWDNDKTSALRPMLTDRTVWTPLGIIENLAAFSFNGRG